MPTLPHLHDTLILPSIQVNMRGGHFPEPEKNGISYLKLPLNQL